MTITSRSQDKYAFLFTGPTAVGRFVLDLEKVFQVLTEYYNYLPANITVVLGSLTAAPSVPGATVIQIANVDELRAALESFAVMASGPAPGTLGMSKTALLYFSGGGELEESVSKLVIDDGDGTNNVDPTWFTDRLNHFSLCHVNIVMQQPFAGGFISALTGSTLTQWSFTHACNATQDSYGNNVVGSYFTDGWVKGLKLEILPAGTPDAGKYADELVLVGGGDRLISLEDAKEFGKQIQDLMGFAPFSTPGYSGVGGPQYLGLPNFLIRDGIPFFESPDIYLTHPNHGYLPPGDLYIPDSVGHLPPYNNTINIDTRNVGTHPVRCYSLGIELFKFGLGPFTDQHTSCDIIPSGGLLFPINVTDIGTPDDKKDTYSWNTPFFETAVHQCVKAEAKLLCGGVEGVDFIWSIIANDFEGQRNIDEMPIVPTPPLPSPFPFQNLRGFKEHIYSIQNRLDSRRRFLLIFPKEYKKYQGVIKLTWFEVVPGPRSERIPIKVVDEPVLHIPFLLKAGEKKDILLQVRMKPEFDIEAGLKLPFEIVVEGQWPDEARTMTHAIPLPNYAPIAGFTVTIKKGSCTLKGTVLDRKDKPVAKAKVFLRTVNNLQAAVVTTDLEGRYTFPDINPDVYYMRVETEQGRSKEQTIILLSGKEKEIKVHLTE